MFLSLPPTSRARWVYDDPSGVAEPTPFARPWPRRAPKRAPQVVVVRNRVRVAHREG